MTNTTSPKAEKTDVSAEIHKGVENHKTAAKHHEAAAKHHHEAVKHHEAGNHEKAAESTVKANGHSKLAQEAQTEDEKAHASDK
jgi:hypothetical protein